MGVAPVANVAFHTFKRQADRAELRNGRKSEGPQSTLLLLLADTWSFKAFLMTLLDVEQADC